MMKTINKIYFRGGVLTTTTLILMACGAPNAVTDGPHGVSGEVAIAGPDTCFPDKEAVKDNNLSKYKGAISIGLDKEGQFSIRYAGPELQEILNGLTTKAQLANTVANAADNQFVLPPRNNTNGVNPLSFNASSNTTIAFRLEPKNWDFADAGFALKVKNIKKGRFSPFVVSLGGEVETTNKVVLVDYDRDQRTPENQCVYKYELQTAVTSNRDGFNSRLPIILDPDWGNGVPPYGGPTPP